MPYEFNIKIILDIYPNFKKKFLINSLILANSIQFPSKSNSTKILSN